MNMQAFNSRPEVTEQIAQSVQTVLLQIGEDPTREGLVKTPKRVGEALQFLCKGYNEDPEAILLKPVIRPLGIYATCTLPKKGNIWCSQRE